MVGPRLNNRFFVGLKGLWVEGCVCETVVQFSFIRTVGMQSEEGQDLIMDVGICPRILESCTLR